MKTNLFLTVALSTVILSCSKTSVHPQLSVTSQTSNENGAAASSAKKLLTQHIWIYYKYYIGYVDRENLGSLEFRRGGNNNTINLTLTCNHFWFKPDGTTDEADKDGIHRNFF